MEGVRKGRGRGRKRSWLWIGLIEVNEDGSSCEDEEGDRLMREARMG